MMAASENEKEVERVKAIDAAVKERTNSLLDRLTHRVISTLAELRQQGRENGPGIEDEFERFEKPDTGMTEEELDAWWADFRLRRRKQRTP